MSVQFVEGVLVLTAVVVIRKYWLVVATLVCYY